MVRKYFLTCDIGTSVTKTVLYEDTFKAIASASEENPSTHTKACWFEEDPDQWWTSIKREIKTVTKDIDPRNIVGIATCAQMHAPILVDQDGNPLFPSLSWPDKRTIHLVDEVSKETGIHQPYFTSTAPKILWIKRHEAKIIEKTYKVLLPKDFIRMKLSDTFCTDTSDAGGTAMYDSEKKMWNWRIVDYIGLDHDKLPEVYPAEKIVGAITDKIENETGLVAGTPVITGTSDFGIGRRVERSVLKPKNILLYLGTGPGVWWVSPNENPSRRSRTSLCILGVAGTMPQWFKNTFCHEDSVRAEELGINVFDLLDSEAEKIEPGIDGLIVLPHLMGERSYGGRTVSEEGRLNPFASGVFYGLCMGHTRYHMFRAVREGIAYHLRLCWEHIQAANPGSKSNLIVTSGGGANSRLWRQIIADTFNLPVYRLKELETSTLGLACLTASGLGMYKNFEEAASKVKNPLIEQIQPNPNNIMRYTEMFELYKRLEMSLEHFFQPQK
jgi:xylulokinase